MLRDKPTCGALVFVEVCSRNSVYVSRRYRFESVEQREIKCPVADRDRFVDLTGLSEGSVPLIRDGREQFVDRSFHLCRIHPFFFQLLNFGSQGLFGLRVRGPRREHRAQREKRVVVEKSFRRFGADGEVRVDQRAIQPAGFSFAQEGGEHFQGRVVSVPRMRHLVGDLNHADFTGSFHHDAPRTRLGGLFCVDTGNRFG